MVAITTKIVRLVILPLLFLVSVTSAQQTVYNNFGSGNGGWDYNWGLGWTVAGDSVSAQYGVEQAMGFESTATGFLTDIWVAMWYVPLDPGLDTVTVRLTPFNTGFPPDPSEVLEEWVITDFGSWTQWNPPQHLVSNGTVELQTGQSYWLWASGGQTTWCGWCMNIDPALTAPHTLRQEGGNWLPISDETASAFRVDLASQVPVEFTSFTAMAKENGNIILQWSTATEKNNKMFEIERKLENGEYVKIGYVNGSGTTTEPKDYSYVDQTVGTGSYYYRLKQIDFYGTYRYSQEILTETSGPLTFTLGQNYPNPFNPSTIIKYGIPEAGNVKLTVYNPVGEEVAVLVNGYVEAGHYEVTFNASNLPSGMYLYKLESPNSVKIKKMLLLK